MEAPVVLLAHRQWSRYASFDPLMTGPAQTMFKRERLAPVMSIRQALIELGSTVRKSQDLECNGWPLQRWCRKQRIRREVPVTWNRTGPAGSVVLVPHQRRDPNVVGDDAMTASPRCTGRRTPGTRSASPPSSSRLVRTFERRTAIFAPPRKWRSNSATVRPGTSCLGSWDSIFKADGSRVRRPLGEVCRRPGSLYCMLAAV
jgi:hypothetical protein